MTAPIQFMYKCPQCGFTSVSNSPDLEVCTVPLYTDTAPFTCGGDIGDWGPSVWWWQIPDDLQAEILTRYPSVTDEP